MRHYENIFILKPSLGDDEYQEVVKKFRDLLEKSKGILIKSEEWGKQHLAYVLKKFDKGFYILFNFCGESSLISEFERELKLDERVLLFQTVKLADQVDPNELLKKEEEVKTKVPEAEVTDGEEKKMPPADDKEPTEGEKNGIQ